MLIHFGSFAGLLSKAIVVCFGVAFSVLTSSGIPLWVGQMSDLRDR